MQPTVINFKKMETMPDGSQQSINNKIIGVVTIKSMKVTFSTVQSARKFRKISSAIRPTGIAKASPLIKSLEGIESRA